MQKLQIFNVSTWSKSINKKKTLGEFTMFGDIWPLISVVIGILLLLSLIIFLKLNTFISLIVTSVVTAILLGMPLNKIMETIEAEWEVRLATLL